MDYFKIKIETQEAFQNESIVEVKKALRFISILRFLYTKSTVHIAASIIGALVGWGLASINGNYSIIVVSIIINFLIVEFFLFKKFFKNFDEDRKELDIMYETLIDIRDQE